MHSAGGGRGSQSAASVLPLRRHCVSYPERRSCLQHTPAVSLNCAAYDFSRRFDFFFAFFCLRFSSFALITERSVASLNMGSVQ